MNKKRKTMQVSINFDNFIKEIQGELMEKRTKKSTVDLTEDLFMRKEDLKRLIMEKKEDIKIGFDRRGRI